MLSFGTSKEWGCTLQPGEARILFKNPGTFFMNILFCLISTNFQYTFLQLHTYYYYYYIVTCKRGRVSNKSALGSGQRQDMGSGILTILAMTTYTKF